MNKTLPIMIQGTSSDAGKSMIVTALCRIFAQEGYRTAPFKSQNMALNSYITANGDEIGRAQGVQAEAAGVMATADMNPILIKPSGNGDSQIIVKGKPYQQMEGMQYRKEFYEQGLALIRDSYENLTKNYERIVIEGAGSPAEVNLNDRELVNMSVAKITNAPVIIVGDIEKGGVFASLVGTLMLLPEEDRRRVIGVIINKFRGDKALLQSGLDWFEDYTGVPVLGVVPYLPNLNIEAEDSVILGSKRTIDETTKEVDIAVIRYPGMVNFTDADPFLFETDCSVRFVETAAELNEPDLIILPGSINVIDDLLFLKKSGLEKKLLQLSKNGRTVIFGIGGGYQMLGVDFYQTEIQNGERELEKEQGLGLLPVRTVLSEEKTAIQSKGMITFAGQLFPVKGYEIRKGEIQLIGKAQFLIEKEDSSDGCKTMDERVLGTNLHGVFHCDEFRAYFLNKLRQSKELPPLNERVSFHRLREESFDRLAAHVREHVDVEEIVRKMEEFQQG